MAASTTPAAPANGSATLGNATSAAAASVVSGLSEVKTAPEMPVTTGFEQLSSAEIAAEFMGLPMARAAAERKADTKAKKAPKTKPEATKEEEDEESDSDEEEEGEESDTDEEEKEKEDDTFKGKKGLRKRFNQLLKENPKLKRENKTLREQLDALGQTPETVLSPTDFNPLSTARTDAEVDSQAAEKLADVRAKLRWLNRHPEGGTYGEGTDQEREMSADEVDQAVEYYENLSSSLEQAKTDRKVWLKTYGETVKELGADCIPDLVRPKVATRESDLFKKVPELMRDPAFLQVLADARSGRELREKVGKGIKFVEVKPPVKKKDKGAKSSKSDAPERSKAREKQKDAKPGAGKLSSKQLDQLRTGAQGGDRRSQAAIDAAFLD